MCVWPGFLDGSWNMMDSVVGMVMSLSCVVVMLCLMYVDVPPPCVLRGLWMAV